METYQIILFNLLINERTSNMLKLFQITFEKLYVIITASLVNSEGPVVTGQ